MISLFSARLASGTRFWTLPGSVWEAFWPPRWLKTVLKFFQDPPRADPYTFFSAPRASKSGPRGLQEHFKRPPRAEEASSCVQEASGERFYLPWAPSGPQKPSFFDLKNNVFGMNFQCFQGVPRACQEHSKRHPRAFQDILKQACCVKSFPRYSKTSRPGPPS